MERVKKLTALIVAASIAAAALSFGGVSLGADAAAQKSDESPNYQVIVDKPIELGNQFSPNPKTVLPPDDYEYEFNQKYPAVGSYYHWKGDGGTIGVLRLGLDVYNKYVTSQSDIYKEISIPKPGYRKGLMEYYWISSEIHLFGGSYFSDQISTMYYCNVSPLPVTDAIVSGTLSSTPLSLNVATEKMIYFTFAYNGDFENGLLYASSTNSNYAVSVLVQGVELTVVYDKGSILVSTDQTVQCSSHASNLHGTAAFAYYQEV